MVKSLNYLIAQFLFMGTMTFVTYERNSDIYISFQCSIKKISCSKSIYLIHSDGIFNS